MPAAETAVYRLHDPLHRQLSMSVTRLAALVLCAGLSNAAEAEETYSGLLSPSNRGSETSNVCGLLALRLHYVAESAASLEDNRNTVPDCE